jgi:hypothetical protein
MGAQGQEVAESAFTIEATRRSYEEMYAALLSNDC